MRHYKYDDEDRLNNSKIMSLHKKISNSDHFHYSFNALLSIKFDSILCCEKDSKLLSVISTTSLNTSFLCLYKDIIHDGIVSCRNEHPLPFIIPFNTNFLKSRKVLKMFNSVPQEINYNVSEYSKGMSIDHVIRMNTFIDCNDNDNKNKIKYIIQYYNSFIKNLYFNIFTQYFGNDILTQDEINNIENIEVYSIFTDFNDKSIYMKNQDLYSQPFYRLDFNVAVQTKINRKQEDIHNSFLISFYIFPFVQKIFVPIINIFNYNSYQDDKTLKYLNDVNLKYYCAQYKDENEIFQLIQTYLCIVSDDLYHIILPTITNNPNRITSNEIQEIRFNPYMYIGNIYNKIIKIKFNNDSNKVYMITDDLICPISTVSSIPNLIQYSTSYKNEKTEIVDIANIETKKCNQDFSNFKIKSMDFFLNNNDEIINHYKNKFGSKLRDIIDLYVTSLSDNDKMKVPMSLLRDEIDYNNVDIVLNNHSHYNSESSLINSKIDGIIVINLKPNYGTVDSMISLNFIQYADYFSWEISNSHNISSVAIASFKKKNIALNQNEFNSLINKFLNTQKEYIRQECEKIVNELIDSYYKYIDDNAQLKEEYSTILDSFVKNNKFLLSTKFYDNINNYTDNKNIEDFEDIELFFDQINYFMGTKFNLIPINKEE